MPASLPTGFKQHPTFIGGLQSDRGAGKGGQRDRAFHPLQPLLHFGFGLLTGRQGLRRSWSGARRQSALLGLQHLKRVPELLVGDCTGGIDGEGALKFLQGFRQLAAIPQLMPAIHMGHRGQEAQAARGQQVLHVARFLAHGSLVE